MRWVICAPAAFTSEHRRALFAQRVLVLDGSLDDDNGTVLMTWLVQLATSDPGTTSGSGSIRPEAQFRRCSHSATSFG